MVHWNRSAYPSPNVAAGEGDGLAVVGLFVDIGEEDHPEFAKLIPYLEKVTHCGEKVPIQEADVAGGLRDGLRLRHGIQQLPGRVQLGLQSRRPGGEEELNYSAIYKSLEI